MTIDRPLTDSRRLELVPNRDRRSESIEAIGAVIVAVFVVAAIAIVGMAVFSSLPLR